MRPKKALLPFSACDEMSVTQKRDPQPIMLTLWPWTSSRTVRNEFLFFKGHPVCGILFWQPDWTKEIGTVNGVAAVNEYLKTEALALELGYEQRWEEFGGARFKKSLHYHDYIAKGDFQEVPEGEEECCRRSLHLILCLSPSMLHPHWLLSSYFSKTVF